MINNNSAYHFQLDGEYFSAGSLRKQDLSTGSIDAEITLGTWTIEEGDEHDGGASVR